MNRLLSRGAAAVALAVAGLAAVPAPAHAADVSAPYTCTSPLGTQPVTIAAALTATPEPATAGIAVTFRLVVAQLGLTSPLTINSWTAAVTLDVSGAESAQVPIAGTGGPVRPNQPIGAVLTGTWTPTVPGTDEVRGGDVAVTANLALVGTVRLTCVADQPQPVAATLTVR